jgi:hypothetical protein
MPVLYLNSFRKRRSKCLDGREMINRQLLTRAKTCSIAFIGFARTCRPYKASLDIFCVWF